MEISIIIAVYNNVRWLEMILLMLEHQTNRNFEVLIADDGSSEQEVLKTKELMVSCSFPIRHVWHEDIGWRKEKVLNEAVIAAKADYLIFLDGDCIPSTHLVEDYMSLRKQGIVDAGRRVQLTEKETKQISPELIQRGYLKHIFWRHLFTSPKRIEDMLYVQKPCFRKWLHADKDGGILGCNFGLYKSDLLLVNGFDEDYKHPGCGEDTDLEARLFRAGIPTIRHRFICHVFHRMHKSAMYEEIENAQHFEWNEQNKVVSVTHGINQHANSF